MAVDRLVFIDDDEDELHEMRPAIFVSDLYVPRSGSVDLARDFADAELARQDGMAQLTARAFQQLYPGERHAKRRMRATMAALALGRSLLDEQWRKLGQSPEYGYEILAHVQGEYPGVPFVFYSRKITPADAVTAVKEKGAADAIQKGSLSPVALMARLRKAQGSRETK